MKGKLVLAVVLALLFVWSLPGVIALRHLLLLLSLLFLAGLYDSRNYDETMRSVLRANWIPASLFALLTGWFVVQAVFVSSEPDWALGELSGQWATAIMALMVGIMLALASRAGKIPDPMTVTTALMSVMLLQAAIAVGQSVFDWIRHGDLLRQQVPLTGGKLEMSFLLNIVLAALVIDLLRRACRTGSFLRLPFAVIVAAVLLVLFCAYLSGSRNGVLGVLFLSASAIILFVIDQHRQRGWEMAAIGGLLALFFVSGFALFSYQGDSRWRVFSESAALGWDIDNHKAWGDMNRHPLPRLDTGERVDESAYLRVAFIHAGIRLIAENPLGVGYGRNAFAHALEKTGNANVGHTHSGFIDLTIGGGLPALALWLAFIVSLMVAGGVAYFRGGNPQGLLLFLLVTGHSGRMVLDSVNRDHMLQIFLFLVGYLLIVVSTSRSPTSASASHAQRPA